MRHQEPATGLDNATGLQIRGQLQSSWVIGNLHRVQEVVAYAIKQVVARQDAAKSQHRGPKVGVIPLSQFLKNASKA